MANAFSQHNISANDQDLLIGAAGRNNDNEMDIVLNTNYGGLQALERIAVKNYAAQQARAQGNQGQQAVTEELKKEMIELKETQMETNKDLEETKKRLEERDLEREEMIQDLFDRRQRLKNTSSYYRLRLDDMLIIENSNFIKRNGIANRIDKDKLELVCEKMKKLNEECEAGSYGNENDMHGDLALLLQESLEILDEKESKEFLVMDMHEERYFASCHKMPDVIMGIKELFLLKPGPLGTQIVMEGSLGQWDDSKIGQISSYIVHTLEETHGEYALGMLYNEKCVQFYATDGSKTDGVARKSIVFSSKVYLWSDIEWVKLFYHFSFVLFLKKNLNEQMGFKCSDIIGNNMSPRGIIGTGASSIVLGVSFYKRINGINDNSGNDNNIKYQFVNKMALKIFLKKDGISIGQSKQLDSLFLNECKQYCHLKSLKNSLPRKGDNVMETKRKSRLIANMKENKENNECDWPFVDATIIGNIEKKQVFGILLPYLKNMGEITDHEYANNILNIAIAMKEMHSLNLFHCDFHLNNVLYDNAAKKIIICDLQTMTSCDISVRNTRAFEYLTQDLIKLLAIIDVIPNNAEIDKWKAKYTRNEWEKIYDNWIFPRIKKYQSSLKQKLQRKKVPKCLINGVENV